MDWLPFLMLPLAFALMFLGVQVVFSMMITALVFGLMTFGNRVIFQFVEKIEDLSSNFVFAAVPLFVFMGTMLERSGIADRLFDESRDWLWIGGRMPDTSGRTRRNPAFVARFAARLPELFDAAETPG